MCECHSDAIEALRGTAKLPFGYGVIDKTGEDMELFATRDEAIARARECHRHYPHIRPFRVMRISMHPISDDDPDDQEVRDRETLTERRAEEAERSIRAISEETP